MPPTPCNHRNTCKTILGVLDHGIPKFESFSTIRWNSLIQAHIDAGDFDAAFSLFSTMRSSGARPDHFTLPLVNRALSAVHDRLSDGQGMQSLGIKMGYERDVYFCNTLIGMYVKYGCVGLAHQVFGEMSVRDVVSWTSLISGYILGGDILEAFHLFSEMRMAGVEPNAVSLAVVLRACCVKQMVLLGRLLYGFVMKSGLECHELVQNSVLMMFSKVDCLKEMETLFETIRQSRDVVAWNIRMAGYSSRGDAIKVLECFEDMRIESISPSHETLTLVTSALKKVEDLIQGKKVHAYAMQRGLIDAVLRASLIDFYGKCGDLLASARLFGEVTANSIVIVSPMMWGFVQNEQFIEAIDLFQKIRTDGFEPNADIICALVLACTHLGVLQIGHGIHGYLIRHKSGISGDVESLETSILNMYVKCGSLVSARRCFDCMAVRDVIAWSSMVEGYAVHGLGLEALKVFQQMQDEGIQPNSVTFLSLLTACSHSGLVNEGLEVFNRMVREYKVQPELSHYTSMVDLLGRSGNLCEALGIIKSMTMEPDGRMWGALLASCWHYSDTELATYAAKRLLELEPDNVGYHVLSSNIYASDDRWDVVESSRKLLIEKDLKKKPGWSGFEINGRLHTFVAGDRSHNQLEEIYWLLEHLTRHIKEAECISCDGSISCGL